VRYFFGRKKGVAKP